LSKRWRKNGRVFLTEQVGGEAAVVESIAALGGDVEARRCNEFKTVLPFLLFVSSNFRYARPEPVLANARFMRRKLKITGRFAPRRGVLVSPKHARQALCIVACARKQQQRKMIACEQFSQPSSTTFMKRQLS